LGRIVPQKKKEVLGRIDNLTWYKSTIS